jgi:hypothetical protein
MKRETTLTKLSDALFLTIGCDGHYAGMLADHRARHLAYCDRWGIDYLAENPADAIMDTFGRLDFILKWLKSGRYRFVFWIDADCIVSDFDHDMRETVPEWAWLGMTIAPERSAANIVHYQTGCMYWRACRKSVEFIECILSVRNEPLLPVGSGLGQWNDQEVMNLLLLNEDDLKQGFVNLSPRWNMNTLGHDTEIVAAWHGRDNPMVRRRLMQEYAKSHDWRDK